MKLNIKDNNKPKIIHNVKHSIGIIYVINISPLKQYINSYLC